jgi:hypothetical protein
MLLFVFCGFTSHPLVGEFLVAKKKAAIAKCVRKSIFIKKIISQALNKGGET